MRNRICKRCKSTKVIEIGSYGGTTYYRCETCQDWGEKDQFPELTLFDRITASPEVLAEKLVYSREFVWGDDCGNEETEVKYLSTITDEVYSTEAEALAATVEKLKEVCDES